MNFLTEMFQNPLEFSTLNVYRSALSAYHPEIDGFKVGQHPLVKELMKGAFNTRPPQPKYTETWDVNKVLDFITQMGANDILDQSSLTQKLAMLMGLVSAGRSKELCSLDLRYMMDFGSHVKFMLGKPTKTKKMTTNLGSVVFRKYPDDQLDVVACLKRYIQITEPLRKSESQKQQLFIACVKPHKPVAPCTIARWLKTLMGLAGIDVTKFSGHSVRSASTSKAKRCGLSTPQVLERANWSNAGTFHKFYYRELSDDFQQKVLDKMAR